MYKKKKGEWKEKYGRLLDIERVHGILIKGVHSTSTNLGVYDSNNGDVTCAFTSFFQMKRKWLSNMQGSKSLNRYVIPLRSQSIHT